MVDAKHVHKRLDDEVPAGAINEALEQIAYADRIILNKTDLVRLSAAAGFGQTAAETTCQQSANQTDLQRCHALEQPQIAADCAGAGV